MGVYDREYIRNDGPGWFGGSRTMVTNLILLNVAVYFALLLVDTGRAHDPDAVSLTGVLGLNSGVLTREVLTHPWWLLGLVTYGFAHDVHDIFHVVFNMLGLWFFGRDLESRFGSREFLGFYLTGVIVSGMVWAPGQNVAGNTDASLIGASGGVAATMLLFAAIFPTRLIYIWGVLPVPAWALAILWVFGDMRGATGRSGDPKVAYMAHLAGAAYGFIYFQTQWSLARFVPRNFSLAMLKPRPRLRVHNPEDFEENMSEEVDEILRKIGREGQDSLTARERRILEQASRRYQQKHR